MPQSHRPVPDGAWPSRVDGDDALAVNPQPVPDHVHNARINLLATLLNNASLAFIGGGFIAPAVTGQMHGGWHILATFAWIGFGFGLHLAARAVLGRLR